MMVTVYRNDGNCLS